MEKEKFLQAMKFDNGRHNEIELGKSLGLDEDSTMKIISKLLSEFKIDYVANRSCNYKIK
jgi:hypothetical protein